MQAAAVNWHKYLNVYVVVILIRNFTSPSISSCWEQRTSSLLVPSISGHIQVSLAMGLLATGPGWLRWAGNTLNLGLIRVTSPHLLGLAHNCDDLFLLSKPNGMSPTAPLLLACFVLSFFLFLIHILFVFLFRRHYSLSALRNIKCGSSYVPR